MSAKTRAAVGLVALLGAGCVDFREAWRGWTPDNDERLYWVTPEIRSVLLPNGLTVLVVESSRFDRVAVAAAFRLGSASDPPGREGLASLAVHMLPEGSAGRDARAFHDTLERMDGTMSLSVGPDGALLGWTVPAEHAAEAVALLADAVLTPSFDAEALQGVREAHLAAATLRAADPTARGEQRLLSGIYGADHPWAHPPGGTAQSLAATTAEGARAFYQTFVGPKTTALVFAGPIGTQEAVALAARHFGGWTRAARDIPSVPRAAPLWDRPAGFYNSLRDGPATSNAPGQRQAVMVFGLEGARAGDKDEVPLLLGSYALEQLLHHRLRDVKGYTYAVGASSWAGAESGLVMGASQLRRENAKDAERELRAVLAAVPEVFVRDDDAFEGVKQAVLRSSIGEFGTVGACAGAAVRLFWQRQGPDRYERLYAEVQAANADEVGEVIRREFDRTRVLVAIVGVEPVAPSPPTPPPPPPIPMSL